MKTTESSRNLDRYIYTLIDPRSNNVRYVGVSLNPEKRLVAHMNPSQQNPKGKQAKWLRELKSLNLVPHLQIIDKCTLDKVHDVERGWIVHYLNLGADLNNATSYRSSPLLLDEFKKLYQLKHHKELTTDDDWISAALSLAIESLKTHT